ncbi:DUF805 domain-containing protein [Niveibacterium terrae]|uniref:DUF805 domain-containing protein n=1 Tax=Niveibacterium terrae TaxID=3373598 RepID=UPI003A8CA45F
MPSRYRVILNGQILAGHDPAEVRAALARSFRIADAQLDLLFSHRRIMIKRDASAEEAERLARLIRALGMDATVESTAPPPEQAPAPTPAPEPTSAPASAPEPKAAAPRPASEELFSLAPPAPPSTARETAVDPSADNVTCPQCGEIQPRRTLCRHCGLDMPRYHRAQAALQAEPPPTAQPSQHARPEPEREVKAETAEPGESAPLLSLSFSGRLPRMAYLGGSLFGTGAALSLIALGLSSGIKGLGTLAMLALLIYTFRIAALRLHDTGRSGWMSLLMLVPLLGQIFALALLLIPGDELENDYGETPEAGGGKAALMGLALIALALTLSYKAIERDPVAAREALLGMGWGQRARPAPKAVEAPPPPAETEPQTPRYAYENQVALYSASDCDSCAAMRRWLQSQDIHFVEHAIDANPAAAAALREKLSRAGIDGQIRLPVLEVNGEMIANDPEISEVQKHLKMK